MYVDEKKAGEAEVDTRSDLERFIAWAKTQDPEETFMFTDPHNCLIARWHKSENRFRPLPSHEAFALFGGRGKEIVFYGHDAGDLRLNDVKEEIRTVGSALAIAKRIQGEQ